MSRQLPRRLDKRPDIPTHSKARTQVRLNEKGEEAKEHGGGEAEEQLSREAKTKKSPAMRGLSTNLEWSRERLF